MTLWERFKSWFRRKPKVVKTSGRGNSQMHNTVDIIPDVGNLMMINALTTSSTPVVAATPSCTPFDDGIHLVRQVASGVGDLCSGVGDAVSSALD